MGTRWFAVFFSSGAAASGFNAALQAAVDEVDATMSTGKVDSDLMRLNRTPPGIWLDAAPALCAVVALGLQIGHALKGAFDIGVGVAVDAWGFGAGRNKPGAAAIAHVPMPSRRTLAVEVDLSRSRLRRTSHGQIDLSGIAKGYGVDCLADVVIARGLADFVVSINGEMRARGTRPDRSGWAVGLERPDRTQRSLARTIEVSDIAIATSGDYRHWYSYGDETVSHTIDPRTGAPLQNQVLRGHGNRRTPRRRRRVGNRADGAGRTRRTRHGAPARPRCGVHASQRRNPARNLRRRIRASLIRRQRGD